MPALRLDNLDKSTWQTYRFEQIARSIGERVEPSNTDLETYVGLEHIDAESIHIKRFGAKADVSGTKLRCYPGDVIFGRRRAYQRKAAICEFDGFCSAHSLVLRANPKVIDPKLFPFFLHSDTFMHRAVDISVGSLSPTINWTTLKTQQFLLPPKDQQAKLAELFWAADAAIESQTENDKAVQSAIAAIFLEAISESHDDVPLSEVGEVVTGATPSTKNKSFWDSGSVPFITPADFNDSPYIDHVERTITKSGLGSVRPLPANSVLVVSIGATIGKVAISKTECATNQQINAIIPRADFSPIYVMQALRILKHRILARSGATTLPIINKGEFCKVRIPRISKDKANRFEAGFNSIASARDAGVVRARHSRELLKSLINQIF